MPDDPVGHAVEEVIRTHPIVLLERPEGFRVRDDLVVPERNPPTAVLLDPLREQVKRDSGRAAHVARGSYRGNCNGSVAFRLESGETVLVGDSGRLRAVLDAELPVDVRE